MPAQMSDIERKVEIVRAIQFSGIEGFSIESITAERRSARRGLKTCLSSAPTPRACD